MNSTVIVLIVVVVLLLLALGAVGARLARKRKSEQLQEHYGPEYERTLSRTGDQRATEAALAEREKRHRELDVRDLKPEERERFDASWAEVQRDFVDDPVDAVRRADALVVDIMRTRGYPVDDFERRAEDISVEHPQVVQHYRDANSTRSAIENGDVDTERQRHAITSYRALVDALLDRDPSSTGPAAAHSTAAHTTTAHDSTALDSTALDSTAHTVNAHTATGQNTTAQNTEEHTR